MNRGLARRAVFEDRECSRFFLCCLARTIRAGLLEVHAYCLLTDPFHLLVRSPQGALAEALRQSQNRYVRWFNRRPRRDEPLFRGRFRSRLVENIRYRRHLVAYVDGNPVRAGVVPAAELSPYANARHNWRTKGPVWLDRSWVEAEARLITGEYVYGPDTYRRAFGRPLTDSERELVESRLDNRSRESDPLDDLVVAVPQGVRLWLERKALNADGKKTTLPCCSSGAILRRTESRRHSEPGLLLKQGTRAMPVWPPMLIGLLRDLAAATWSEAHSRSGLGSSATRRAYETHRVWLGESDEYGRWVGEVGAESLRQ